MNRLDPNVSRLGPCEAVFEIFNIMQPRSGALQPPERRYVIAFRLGARRSEGICIAMASAGTDPENPRRYDDVAGLPWRSGEFCAPLR